MDSSSSTPHAGFQSNQTIGNEDKDQLVDEALNVEFDFGNLDDEFELGRILVVLPESQKTVEDIKQLTGSSSVDEIIKGDVFLSNEGLFISNVRTAYELLNRQASSEGLRFYRLDDNAVSTLYAMADPAFTFAVDFDVVSFHELCAHASHATNMLIVRDELWNIVKYYDNKASHLPSPRNGISATDEVEAVDMDVDAVIARATYQLCLRSYAEALEHLRAILAPSW